MPRVTPFLWFDTQAEAAANYYVSLFPNPKVGNITRYGEAGPGPKGSVMTVEFELDGQMEAMLKMKKIDIAGLKRAYDQQ
jgi:predicted 3-demethylubiquinone-9 3-methyltransferase (glyoxalase superfamily)